MPSSLMYPRFPFECRPPAPPIPCRSHQALPNSARYRAFPFLLDYSLPTTHHLLIPLESALPKNAPVTRLESADPKSLDLKPFRIRTYRKGWGRGVNC